MEDIELWATVIEEGREEIATSTQGTSRTAGVRAKQVPGAVRKSVSALQPVRRSLASHARGPEHSEPLDNDGGWA